MESRQPLILLTCSDTATFPSMWVYLGLKVCTKGRLCNITRRAPLDAFAYTATFGPFGFLTVYLLTCIVAPVELFRARELSMAKLAMHIIGVSLMAFVLIAESEPIS
jgi:hypothetical protein